MTRAYIMAGGELELSWAKEELKDISSDDIVIAADRGLLYLDSLKIVPKLFVGDMDSVPKELYDSAKIHELKLDIHPVRKDETDLRLAMLDAADLGVREAYIYGATGGRLDHFLANVYILAEALEYNIKAYLINSQNRISILKEGCHTFTRSETFGKYISFLAFGGEAEISAMKGFSYNVADGLRLKSYDTIGISNEIVDEKAEIVLKEGCLIMIEARDKSNE